MGQEDRTSVRVSVELVDADVVPMDYQVVVHWRDGKRWIVMQDRKPQCDAIRKKLMRLASEAAPAAQEGP